MERPCSKSLLRKSFHQGLLKLLQVITILTSLKQMIRFTRLDIITTVKSAMERLRLGTPLRKVLPPESLVCPNNLVPLPKLLPLVAVSPLLPITILMTPWVTTQT